MYASSKVILLATMRKMWRRMLWRRGFVKVENMSSAFLKLKRIPKGCLPFASSYFFLAISILFLFSSEGKWTWKSAASLSSSTKNMLINTIKMEQAQQIRKSVVEFRISWAKGEDKGRRLPASGVPMSGPFFIEGLVDCITIVFIALMLRNCSLSYLKIGIFLWPSFAWSAYVEASRLTDNSTLLLRTLKLPRRVH